MTRLRLVTLIFVVVAALGLPSGALASAPQPVTITNALTFEDVSTFSTTGGVVCATGTVSNTFVLFVGQNGRHAQLLVGKHFVCPNGTFDLLLRVRLDFATGVTQGTWSVTASSGALAGLHGGGDITGVPIVVGESILDQYTGRLHIDP